MNNRIKSLLFIVLLCSSFNGFAQLTKGNILVNASVGYTQTNTTTSFNASSANTTADSVSVPNSKVNTLTTGIDAEYFIIDNLGIGISCGYSNSVSQINAQGYNNTYYTWNNVTHNFAPGIFAVKYFMITEKFYLSAELHGYYTTGAVDVSYLYNHAPTPVVNALPAEPTTGYNISLSPGMEFFPSPKWNIGFRLANVLGYVSSTQKNMPYGDSYLSNPNSLVTQNKTTSTFDAGFGLVPTLGVSYIFVHKQTDKPSSN